MYRKLKGKTRERPVPLLSKRWYGHWGVSLLLAFAVLIGSLIALLMFSGRSMLFSLQSPVTEVLSTPISETTDPPGNVQGDRPHLVPLFRSPSTTLETPIISAHESATDFEGEIDRLAPDIRHIVERGTLVVAILGNDAFPFFYEKFDEEPDSDEARVGNLEGIDIQIGRSLATYLGVDVVFDRSSRTFDAIVNQVFEGKADLAIAKISLTLDRARKVRYSQPYASLRPGLLFNRLALSNMINFDLHQNPLDVVRQRGSEAHLGVIRASAYANFARSAFPEATITEYSNWDSLVDAIIHGRVLAGCRDELAIKYEILGRSNANMQMQSLVIDEWIDEIAVALPWESAILSEFVNHYLSKAQLLFTADQLLTQFLNTQPKPPASS